MCKCVNVSCGTIKCTMIVKKKLKSINFFLFFFLVKEEDKNASVIKSLLPCFLRERVLLIISLFRLATGRRCGQHCWVCDWRHCEEEIFFFFWKAVNLIVPTKQVRGKRRENHRFLIRLVKYNSYFQVEKKKMSLFCLHSRKRTRPWAVDIPVLHVKSPTTH